MYVLSVTLPGTPEHFTVDCDGPVLIGRSSECDVTLNNPLVSRRHAEITQQSDDAFVVRDLGSLNGTLVQGAPLRGEAIVVQDRGQIQVGPYLIAISRMLNPETDTVLVPIAKRPARVTLDRGRRAVLVDGKTALESLAPLEYRVFDMLEQAAPDLVATNVLGDAVWEPGQWDTYMLHNLIRRLRRKLESVVDNASGLIVTVQGAGYRLG